MRYNHSSGRFAHPLMLSSLLLPIGTAMTYSVSCDSGIQILSDTPFLDTIQAPGQSSLLMGLAAFLDSLDSTTPWQGQRTKLLRLSLMKLVMLRASLVSDTQLHKLDVVARHPLDRILSPQLPMRLPRQVQLQLSFSQVSWAWSFLREHLLRLRFPLASGIPQGKWEVIHPLSEGPVPPHHLQLHWPSLQQLHISLALGIPQGKWEVSHPWSEGPMPPHHLQLL